MDELLPRFTLMFTRHAGVTFRGPTFFVSLLSLLGEENTFGIVCSRSSPGKIPLLTLNALSLSLFSYSSLVWEDDRGETTLRFVIAIKFFLLRMILFSMTIISVKGNECVCVCCIINAISRSTWKSFVDWKFFSRKKIWFAKF